MKKKNKHGGKREGAGGPRKPETKTLSYRVPITIAPKIDIAIRKIISSMSKS